jgi:hypothetical protein
MSWETLTTLLAIWFGLNALVMFWFWRRSK